MNGKTAVARILKEEGVGFAACFPTSPLLDAVAAEGIRLITTRTERVAVGIADGFTRASFGKRSGVCFVQNGPGAENAFAGVAQAFADSVPVLVLPAGYDRRNRKRPLFSADHNYREITKSVDVVHFADQIPTLMRRAFVNLRSGRPGPVMLEVPTDVATEEFDEAFFQYRKVKGWKSGGDPADVERVAKALIKAENPVIRAGNGILYAEASNELQELAELLQIPVFTTMQGKSAFPENHPLSLGTGGRTRPKMVLQFLDKADLVFAVGTSCTKEAFTTNIPDGIPIIQSTIDETDIGKDYPIDDAIIGDAKIVLRQLIEIIRSRIGTKEVTRETAKEAQAAKTRWLKEWMPKLTSEEVPISPYRVIGDFNKAFDKQSTIFIPESGGPRDQSVPFYEAVTPGGFVGWGKTTTLGGSLGFAMGAKLAHPEKTVVHLLGDAGIGMIGIDHETAARERIPILTIVINNSKFGGYEKHIPIAIERSNVNRVGGDYAKVAEALGYHAERVRQPDEIIPAIERAKKILLENRPAFLEIFTRVDTEFSL